MEKKGEANQSINLILKRLLNSIKLNSASSGNIGTSRTYVAKNVFYHIIGPKGGAKNWRWAGWKYLIKCLKNSIFKAKKFKQYTMTFEVAKQLSIKEYLAQLGHHPTKERRGRLAYFSPFRIETEPSFFLNESGGENQEDLWNDFGEGEGGTIIELVIKLNNLSNKLEALKLLGGNQQPLNLPKPATKSKSENPIQIKNTKPLKDERLIQYITEERKIPLGLAKHYLQQIWYQMEDKYYLAIGWKTKGGYELRSGKGFTFKGCSGKKTITLIPSAKDRLYIFESMFDYLSYIVLHSRIVRKRIIFLEGEVIILNSTSMVKRIIPYLQQRKFSEILSFFDNDRAGEKGLATLQEQFSVEQQDFFYSKKDVNEYLIGVEEQLKT